MALMLHCFAHHRYEQNIFWAQCSTLDSAVWHPRSLSADAWLAAGWREDTVTSPQSEPVNVKPPDFYLRLSASSASLSALM